MAKEFKAFEFNFTRKIKTQVVYKRRKDGTKAANRVIVSTFPTQAYTGQMS